MWGLKDCKRIETVQNRTARFFLGVCGNTSILASRGELGWSTCKSRLQIEVLRYWLKLNTLPNDRLVCAVRHWSSKFSHSWDTKVKQLLCDFNLYDLFLQCTDKSQINKFLDTAKTVILKQDFDKWNHELWNNKGNGDNGNKLRTYRTFKSEIGCEQYLKLSNCITSV